jgi:hypothetical protein
MTYFAILENKRKDNYVASILGFPDVTAKGTTRQEALANLRQELNQRLSQVEIVPMETEADHPWLQFAGMWANESHFDEFVADIEAYRRELDNVETDQSKNS